MRPIRLNAIQATTRMRAVPTSRVSNSNAYLTSVASRIRNKTGVKIYIKFPMGLPGSGSWDRNTGQHGIYVCANRVEMQNEIKPWRSTDTNGPVRR